LFGQDLYPGLGGDSGSLVGPWRAGHPITNHRADGPGRMRGVVGDDPYGHGVLVAFVSQAQVTDTVCSARADHDVVTPRGLQEFALRAVAVIDPARTPCTQPGVGGAHR